MTRSDDTQLVVRFPVDDAALSDLHARAFGGEPGVPEPWASRLERFGLSWVGAFTHDQLAHDQLAGDRLADDRLVGFVHACWDGGRHAFLLDTVVDPDWRHGGLGSRLVRQLTAEVEAAGCEWLHVDYEPHLDGFYRGCGFAPTRAGLIRLGG